MLTYFKRNSWPVILRRLLLLYLISPSWSSSRAEMRLRKVVLPEPDSPTMA